MNHYVRPLLGLASFILLVNWGAGESSVTGSRKNAVNFSGTLTTHLGKKLELDNISIAYLYKDIPVYDMPSADIKRVAYVDKKRLSTEDSTKEKFLLAKDPRSGIITKINLANIHEIRVKNPHEIWVFKRKKGYHPLEFVHLEVISNDEKKTKNDYLIEVNRKLIADQINEAGPIEKDIPLESIQSLIIKGYKHRDEQLEKINTKKNRK